MMDLQRLADKVRRLREALGLTQAQFAMQAGLSQARLSRIETGKHHPSLQQVERMARAFGHDPLAFVAGTDWVHPRDASATKAESMAVQREFSRPFDWRPPCDRTMATQVRKSLARRRDQTSWLLTSVRQRPDSSRLLQSFAGVVAGSSVEALFHLVLLAADALSVRVAPLAVGFRKHPVVDPSTREGVGDCAVPAYRLDLQGLRCLLIPQVGLACRKATWCVDFLCAVIGRKGTLHWLLVEIDGDGHDSSSDPFREQDLAMPIVRLNEWEITRGEPLALLHERIAAVLAQPRLPQARAPRR